MDDGINIYRSQVVVNTFHLFIAGAKASLYPFLTLFFRYVGLSATQTGIVIGTRAFLSMVSTPLWISCASKCHRKRCVLVMSIFIMMCSALMMSLVPPDNQNLADDFCLPKSTKPQTNKQGGESGDGGLVVNTTHDTSSLNSLNNAMTSQSVLSQSVHDTKPTLSVQAATVAIPTTTVAIPTTTVAIPTTTVAIPTTRVAMPTTTSASTTTTATSSTTDKNVAVGKEDLHQLVKDIPDNLLKEFGLSRENLTLAMLQEFLKQALEELTSHSPVTTDANKEQEDSLSDSEKTLLKELGLSPEKLTGMDDEQLMEYLVQSLTHNASASRRRRNALSMDSINTEISHLQQQLANVQNAAFIIILSIVIFSELFSCSIERLADKMWFDFADGIDMLEKYGAHKSWEILGWVFVPVLVTVFVDYTDCVLPHGIYHFNIHFYTFAVLMGLGFIWSVMFPMFHDKKKVHRHTSLWKGLKILCVDIHGFSYCVCLLIVGLASAVVDNFLMWQIQDLGGSEMILGGAISMGAFMSLIIHIMLRWIVFKIGSAGALIVALLALAIRMIVYAYLWAPWAVLAVGFLQGFSHTLLLGTIENYPDFKVNPYVMDRSAKSVMSAIYLGVAYTVGSVASGFMYDSIGLQMVYQALAVAILAWVVIFTLIHKCGKHSKKVRYARLLQAEEDQGTDEYDSDDDWLQTALKHEK